MTKTKADVELSHQDQRSSFTGKPRGPFAMTPVRIYNFDRFGDRYLLCHRTGVLRKSPEGSAGWDDENPDSGKIKRFLVGRNVLVYSFGNVPYMRVGKKLERVTDGDPVKQFRFGPFYIYSIRCGRIRNFALGTQWLDFISRFTDPTFDEIDSWAADFSGYVRDLVQKTVNRETS